MIILMIIRQPPARHLSENLNFVVESDQAIECNTLHVLAIIAGKGDIAHIDNCPKAADDIGQMSIISMSPFQPSSPGLGRWLRASDGRGSEQPGVLLALELRLAATLARIE